METDKKDVGLSFMVVKLENQKIPEFKEIKGKEWILWDEKHGYPEYLIDLFLRSSTHNAIVTGKVDYILGGGWMADKTGLSISDQAILNKYISKANPDQSLNELSEPVVTDFEIFNAISLHVIWNKAKTDFDLYHVPFNKLTTNKDETKYWFSNDWSQFQQSEEKTGLKEYNAFDFDKKENGIFVYKIKAPKKGSSPNVYPSPGYIGSTQAIETELECSNYNLAEIKTGFSGGTMITFLNGEPPEDKKKEIEKKIKEKFSGTDKAGSIIVAFSDGADRGSQVDSLQGNDLPERYMEVKKGASQDIFTGHKVSSPMLFGVKTEGQLGGRSEIIEAYELFQNTYISKRQRILEKIFNKFAKLKGCKAHLKLKPTSAIENQYFTESTIIKFLPALAIQEMIADKLGIDLNKYKDQGITTTTQTTEQMNAQFAQEMDFETQVLSKFETIGRPRVEFEFLKSTELFHADTFKVSRARTSYFKKRDDLSGLDRSIIDLLNKDNHLPASEIAKALGKDTKTIQESIKKLVAGEFLTPFETGSDVKETVYEPSADAVDVVDNDGAKTVDIEVLYSYELRPNAPALLGVSRPFCKRLVDMDKLYTKEEIDGLSNEFGTDVWTYKGGWYTNPKTDAPTPQCRHIWKQNVVKRK